VYIFFPFQIDDIHVSSCKSLKRFADNDMLSDEDSRKENDHDAFNTKKAKPNQGHYEERSMVVSGVKMVEKEFKCSGFSCKVI